VFVNFNQEWSAESESPKSEGGVRTTIHSGVGKVQKKKAPIGKGVWEEVTKAGSWKGDTMREGQLCHRERRSRIPERCQLEETIKGRSTERGKMRVPLYRSKRAWAHKMAPRRGKEECSHRIAEKKRS